MFKLWIINCSRKYSKDLPTRDGMTLESFNRSSCFWGGLGFVPFDLCIATTVITLKAFRLCKALERVLKAALGSTYKDISSPWWPTGNINCALRLLMLLSSVENIWARLFRTKLENNCLPHLIMALSSSKKAEFPLALFENIPIQVVMHHFSLSRDHIQSELITVTKTHTQ